MGHAHRMGWFALLNLLFFVSTASAQAPSGAISWSTITAEQLSNISPTELSGITETELASIPAAVRTQQIVSPMHRKAIKVQSLCFVTIFDALARRFCCCVSGLSELVG